MRVALEIALVVKPFADAIDPTPAKYDVDSFFRRARFEPRIHLVDLDPDFVFLVVVFAEPRIETLASLNARTLSGLILTGAIGRPCSQGIHLS